VLPPFGLALRLNPTNQLYGIQDVSIIHATYLVNGRCGDVITECNQDLKSLTKPALEDMNMRRGVVPEVDIHGKAVAAIAMKTCHNCMLTQVLGLCQYDAVLRAYETALSSTQTQ
jgi:hypothetical protein